MSWTRLSVPCALGTRRILLPHDLHDRLGPAEMEVVLAHECAHLLRRDPLWNLALSLLAHLFWFQPLNWLALRAWRNASEELCDAWAARRTSPLTLAQAVLTLARDGQQVRPPSLLTRPAARPTHLSQRIHALIEPQETHMNRPRLLALAAVPALLGLAVPPLAFASGAGQKPLMVVLDAAHGGPDPGAVGLNGQVREDQIVLAIARKVRAKLGADGVRVIMTRDGSEGVLLPDRVKQVPPSADAFLSIHANASQDPAQRGVQTLTGRQEAGAPILAKSLQLADRVRTAVVANTGAADREGMIGSYYVLQKTKVPATIVLVGFITNDGEARALQDPTYQDRVAQGIVESVLQRGAAQR